MTDRINEPGAAPPQTTTYTNGRYSAEVLDQGFEESSSKGTPGFFLKLKILNRYAADGQLEACQQYERRYIQYLGNETGFNILRADLKALGVQFTDLEQLDPTNPGHVRLVGRKVDVIREVEVYEGRERERWRIPRRKLGLDAVRALGAQYRHLLRDGNAPAPPAPPAAGPNDNDAAP
jgi:hypothetical protein